MRLTERPQSLATPSTWNQHEVTSLVNSGVRWGWRWGLGVEVGAELSPDPSDHDPGPSYASTGRSDALRGQSAHLWSHSGRRRRRLGTSHNTPQRRDRRRT